MCSKTALETQRIEGLQPMKHTLVERVSVDAVLDISSVRNKLADGNDERRQLVYSECHSFVVYIRQTYYLLSLICTIIERSQWSIKEGKLLSIHKPASGRANPESTKRVDRRAVIIVT